MFFGHNMVIDKLLKNKIGSTNAIEAFNMFNCVILFPFFDCGQNQKIGMGLHYVIILKASIGATLLVLY